MPTLSWNLNAGIQNGPQIAVAQTLAVDGYDKTEVIIPHHTGTDSTSVGTGADSHVKFFALLADRYSDEMTYHVDGVITAPAGSIKLDAPQILAGAGALALLGADPVKLVFINHRADSSPVAVQILVGRTSM